MAYFNTSNNGENGSASIRQADGKVLGRVRMEVKSSTPQAGMKDYRFFVEPLSPLPPFFSDSPKYGFTGFLSRTGCGFNAFDSEEEALRYLRNEWGDFFVTFTPSVRNHKFYVLDDLQKEGPVVDAIEEEGYVPMPAFGAGGHSTFGGDINKFCRHILTGKPIPGLSKKYWNNTFTPHAVIVMTDNFDGRLGDAILFAPLEGGEFAPRIISEGGAYFYGKNDKKIGYKILRFTDEIIENHVVRCHHAPLWFVSEDFVEELKADLKELPADGDILRLYGIESEDAFFSAEEINGIATKGPDGYPLCPCETDLIFHKGRLEEDIEEPEETEGTGEAGFIDGLLALAEAKGLLYDEKDLMNFHISLKSARLTILSGLSGMGKSQLVRLYGEALGLSDEQILMVPVRPSWMDDSDILGYADTRQMVYRPADTGLTELLLQGEKNPDKLYLVCFDEMNLARAEHYFAQFISVLEKEGTPSIRLYNPALQGRLYNGDAYPPDISIGRNILFIGTVNVDESTYHFSDKILDRANVLTLHRGRFSQWKHLKVGDVPEKEEISAREFDTYRTQSPLELTDRELALLDDLNRAFEESHIECGIGFRVARQIDSYLKNIPEGYDFDREKGLDCQMVQRILTKLRGSAQQLENLIHLSDKGDVEGSLLSVLTKYKDLSPFEESKALLARKGEELKLYDYTI